MIDSGVTDSMRIAAPPVILFGRIQWMYVEPCIH
jgi:hypothetical protein